MLQATVFGDAALQLHQRELFLGIRTARLRGPFINPEIAGK